MTTDYARARRHLARRDPVIRDLMRAHGKCGLADAQHGDPFGALMKAIVSQQLSTKAAHTIFTRLIALFDGAPTPRALAALTDVQLRACRPERPEAALHARPGGQGRRTVRCPCRRSTR